MTSIRAHLLDGLEDPRAGPDHWEKLLAAGDTDTVFLTWQWQRAWWDSFGRGDLLLIAAERRGKVIAIAPFFAEAGMVFFVGSGGSDYLDFVGDINDVEVLGSLLEAARNRVERFVGFRFYHVSATSRTGERLQQAAGRLGLTCYDEGELPAPALALTAQSGAVEKATQKKSLLRHERFFRSNGSFDVRHLREGEAILPHLGEFFEQHIRRWADTPYPSLFHDRAQRNFYTVLTRIAARCGWLRFTCLEWNGRPVAFHFGFCYRGSYMWYKPSFEIELARRSPGEVLLRQLLIAAVNEGAHTFDFGLGDEPFKRRFATHVNSVTTWGLYPPEVLASTGKPEGAV